jgi:hypothetical protein
MTTEQEESYPRAPDLQEWVARYGGYQSIPWAEWDAAMAAWHRARRIYTTGHIENTDDAPRNMQNGRRA